MRFPDAGDVIDGALELAIVPSFTRLGHDVRSRLDKWDADGPVRLDGRVMLVTGSTSGLGLAAAEALAGQGATLILVGRDIDRVRNARDRIAARCGNDRAEALACDMGDLDAVRALAAAVLDRHDRLDVLIHNAGALTAGRLESPQGIEMTVAAQVVGPFLLTSLLLGALRNAAPARVVTMSSGGMYAAPLTVSQLEMGDDYRGSEQYARAKRAQVTLSEMWARRIDPADVVFQAVHPGWADTPGVRNSLPTFQRVLGPLLRSPAQGADTMVWLASADEPLERTGQFWLDRRTRPIHRLPTTRRSDTEVRRLALWSWCVERSGADVGDLGDA